MNLKVVLLAAVCSTIGFSSCSDDDDNYQPDSMVEKAFDTKYPNAQRISWESKNGYQVADFIDGSFEAEAWFDPKGEWMMTETDIHYTALPQEVKVSFEGSIYAQWKQDDIDKLERKGLGTIFIIEVEKGNQEFDLYYSEAGLLIKELADTDHSQHLPSILPNQLTTLISEMYPNSIILEIENEKIGIKADIVQNHIHKEVYFDSSNKWLFTSWEIRLNKVPEIVINALKNSGYASYQIDDIHIVEQADKELSFTFELELGDKEINLSISASGIILK